MTHSPSTSSTLSDGVRGLLVEHVDRTADHVASDVAKIHVPIGVVPHADHRAVAQDDDAVCDALHLPEEVRDVDDADACLGDPPHHPQNPLGILDVEHRGRFVHDQHPWLEHERLEDLHELLLGHGQALDEFPRVELDAEETRLLDEPALYLLVVDEHPRPDRLATDEHVLQDTHGRYQEVLLMDDVDPGRLRVHRVESAVFLALDDDAPRVRLVAPGEDLHEGRLSGPVLAADAQDLAGVHVEGDVA